MSVATIIALLQVIALVLPAIGIYMEIVVTTRSEARSRGLVRPSLSSGAAEVSPFGHAFHVMRVSVLSVALAGAILMVALLIELPPNIGGVISKVGGGAVQFGIYISILFLIFGLAVFGLAIAYQQSALRDELSVIRSLSILKDHILGNQPEVRPDQDS